MSEHTEYNSSVDQNRMIILSIKPRFADAILVGTKTVELRRTKPKIVVPTRALIYASMPVGALLGTCVVETVITEDIVSLWRVFGSRTGLLHGEFLRYFEGVRVGTALTLSHPERFPQQIALADLRSERRGFRPPQSFAYVDAETGMKLLRMAA